MAAAPWLGDYSTTAIVVAEFGTYNSSGGSVTMNVNGSLSVFESTSTAALASTSITFNEDYRGITGAHNVQVDLTVASTLVTIGRDYSILLANSSLDGATVSGPLATFSVRNRSFRPTSTGGAVAATVLDKTGYTASVTTAVTISTASIIAGVQSSGRIDIADTLLDRDMSVGTDSGSTSVRTVRQALRALRNRFGFGVDGSTLTYYKEDDSTPSWSTIVAKSSDATPIVGSDPLGPA